MVYFSGNLLIIYKRPHKEKLTFNSQLFLLTKSVQEKKVMEEKEPLVWPIVNNSLTIELFTTAPFRVKTQDMIPAQVFTAVAKINRASMTCSTFTFIFLPAIAPIGEAIKLATTMINAG